MIVSCSFGLDFKTCRDSEAGNSLILGLNESPPKDPDMLIGSSAGAKLVLAPAACLRLGSDLSTT